MTILLSPSKTLKMECDIKHHDYTGPAFLKDSQELLGIMKTYSTAELQTLMKVSEKIAALNVERYQHMSFPFTRDNAAPALYAFRGDVYDGLDADSMSDDNVGFASRYLRILSGFYGLLRPLDLMQAYRLEMGTRLENERGKNLYAFWGDILTNAVNDNAQQTEAEHIVNLASNEYFSAIDAKKLTTPLITPVFKEKKGSDYKIVGLFAKKARGRMARHLINEKELSLAALLSFDKDGYGFNESLSDKATLVFTRG